MTMLSPHTSRAELTRFGQTVGLAFIVLAAILLVKEHAAGVPIVVAGVCLMLAGRFAPEGLASLYRAWMTVARALGKVMGPVLLTLTYYLLVTLLAFVARLAQKKFLEVDIDRNRATYWQKVSKPSKSYERQF